MSVTIKQGHVISVLAGMEPESCHVAVTSPPYWNLRAYGTEPQVWPELDGRAPCVGGTDLRTREPVDGHEWGESGERRKGAGHALSNSADYADARDKGKVIRTGAFCTRCGAWRGELGSEPDPSLFVSHLVAVFRGVRRVLRRDGTCWINLAGSYLNNPGGQNGSGGHVSAKAMSANGAAGRQDRTGALPRGYWLRPLSFVDTPGLLAHALQRDGWIWRADIALVKKAPLPESVQGWRWEPCRVKVAEGKSPARNFKPELRREVDDVAESGFPQGAEWADCPGCPKCAATEGYVLRRGNGRPTRAWERLMVFAREPGSYYDTEAVREPLARPDLLGAKRNVYAPKWDAAVDGGGRDHERRKGTDYANPAGRNLRDWQFFPQNQLRDAHYAAFSPDLASLAIRAGTSERGCCPACGAPWARVVERLGPTKPNPHERRDGANDSMGAGGTGLRQVQMGSQWPVNTRGWRPTCSCPQTAPPVPATILDPFAGSGSSLIAADRLGRDAIGIDLNSSYTEMAVRRVTRDAPLFADVALHAPAAEPVQARAMALPLDLAGAAGAGDVADEAAGE